MESTPELMRKALKDYQHTKWEWGGVDKIKNRIDFDSTETVILINYVDKDDPQSFIRLFLRFFYNGDIAKICHIGGSMSISGNEEVHYKYVDLQTAKYLVQQYNLKR